MRAPISLGVPPEAGLASAAAAAFASMGEEKSRSEDGPPPRLKLVATFSQCRPATVLLVQYIQGAE